MSSAWLDAGVRDLLREAAQWRLIGLLFECPAAGWRDQLMSLASEVHDDSLREAAALACNEAEEGLYHTTFGPGGPAPPREVSYRDTVHPGRFLAEIRDGYQAFAYAPHTPETPDHVATEAGFVAYLRFKEAYARSRGDAEQAALCRRAAGQFLEEHLSVMAQPLAARLEVSGVGYLARAGAALLERVEAAC
ncbi:MAG: molecular chaperone TorD family protein [Pirellulales bacterium]|nr:molecular chaperone TorD family protein [Pirellulales bacterium]